MKNRLSFLIILLFLSSAASFYFSSCEKEPVPGNRLSAYFSRHGDNPASVLTQLYSRVNEGGYIYVAIYSFTDIDIRNALITAKNRGVEVRVITDRGQVKGNRDQRELLMDLKNSGVPVKMNVDTENQLMHMKVSIIDDRYVITGSYNYTICARKKNEENLLVIPGRVDKTIVQRYKEIFLAMWSDKNNYRDF